MSAEVNVAASVELTRNCCLLSSDKLGGSFSILRLIVMFLIMLCCPPLFKTINKQMYFGMDQIKYSRIKYATYIIVLTMCRQELHY